MAGRRYHLGSSHRPTIIALAPGERVRGTVLRLPKAGERFGNYVILDVGAIAATAKLGATVLGRELERQNITAGDRVEIGFDGMRSTLDGEREYRAFRVVRR